MVDLKTLDTKTLQAMDPAAMAEVAARMLAELAAQARQLQRHEELAQRHEREIKFKDAKLEKVTFELARLKAWKFGARTERMNAEQRQMFEDTCAEDEADLQAQLLALQGDQAASSAGLEKTPRQPRRQKLPEHLRRIEHRHEPADTTCGCAWTEPSARTTKTAKLSTRSTAPEGVNTGPGTPSSSASLLKTANRPATRRFSGLLQPIRNVHRC